MKRFLSFLLFTGFIYGSFAQDAYIPLNYDRLEKKLSKNNSAIDHKKKSLNPQTWVQRGEIMMDVYRVDIDQIFEGMDKITIRALLKEPVSIEEKTVNDVPSVVMIYERVKLILEDGRLTRWEKTKSLVDNPLDNAYDAFVKAIDLDERSRYTKKIHDNLISLKELYKQAGLNTYYSNNKKRALEDFMMVLKINELELFEGEIDTIMLQYTGIIAREIRDYETAAKQYEGLASIGFGGPNTYLLLKEDYLANKDTAKAIDVLERGFVVYPDSLSLVANLIDMYIQHDMIEEGLKTIDKSINSSPQKGEFYYWKGRLLINSDDDNRIDDALEVYKKAIKADPTIYYVYYDIGLIHFLHGQDLFNQAGAERDLKTREIMTKFATEKYQEAIPMLEKSLQYNKVNNEIRKETLDTLKRVYYRLQMTAEYEETDKKLMEMRNP